MPRFQELHPVAVEPDDTFFICGRQWANHVLMASPDDWGTVAKVDNYPSAASTTITLKDGRQFDLWWHERVWVERAPVIPTAR